MSESASQEPTSFTAQQLAAIGATGNALVIAGAGTGKTRTLVERCIQYLLLKNIGLEQILMVTFTDAAAAEMRRRIRERLARAQEQDPANPRLAEQIALLENASICTLHSFCLKLVRQHFYELELDPQLTVLTESQARILKEEVLDRIFQSAYAGDHPRANEVCALIRLFGEARDRKLRDLIYQIHEHTQTRPDPQAWFDRELAKLEAPDPQLWEQWLLEGACELERAWRPLLEADAAECPHLAQCAKVVKAFAASPSRKDLASALERIQQIHDSDWQGQRTEYRKPFERFFKEAQFLRSVATIGEPDPLLDDWQRSAPSLRTLVRLAHEFAQQFSAAKHEIGGVDFHDLEQFSLRLLWQNGQPSPLAQEWQRKLELVFVDEYQDINPAQDQILRAVSRPDAQANRFLVGDIKQSIYGFRQAEPEIFLRYARAWQGTGACFPLSHNFRSRDSLLDFINGVFNELMQRDLGGIDYRAEGQLQFADRELRQHLARQQDARPCAEFILCLHNKEEAEEDDRTKAEREAHMMAMRLKELHESGDRIWDEGAKSLRPIEWRDIVILLRAAQGKVEAYAKEFDKAGVPLLASAGAFFEALEVQDLLNLLRLLDNPIQDRPLLAVLRSPLAGLSIDELVHVRLAAREAPFWDALQCWYDASRKKPSTPTFDKVSAFLERFRRWRSLARCSSLTHRLERILEETNYLDWLLTQSRPEQRRANIQQLLNLAREFDDLHRENLHAFMHFLETEQEAGADRELPPVAVGNAVRLMTIHKSKGLEFPIVVLPDLAKPFNTNDTKGELILDPNLGVCSRVHAPETGQSYPSLPFWLARQRAYSKMLAEELRLLYVAMTRAQERLIVSATVTEGAARNWTRRIADYAQPCRLRRARSCIDWLGPWFASKAKPDWLDLPQGANDSCNWRIIRSLEESGPRRSRRLTEQTSIANAQPASDSQFVNRGGVNAAPRPREGSVPPQQMTPSELNDLQARLTSSYPHSAATEQPAKSSVTALRREAADEPDLAAPFVHRKFPRARFGELDAAAIGLAHHVFLQWLDLRVASSRDRLKEEAARLVAAGLLSTEQAAALDLPAVARFWNSEFGQEILSHKHHVQREIPFTVRLTRESDPSLPLLSRIPAGEFIVVQGVVDLAIMLPDEIWLVDFKTDQISVEEIQEKTGEYSVQLRLYALALREIYRKPVTRCRLHFLHGGQTIELTSHEASA